MDHDQWFPIIHLDQCIGCAECVSHCPTHALEQQNAKAALAHPELCSYCAECETLCPQNAIELPYIVCLAPHAQAKVKP